MIWIKNHGVTGESDDLRIPLRNADAPVVAYQDDGKTTPIVSLRGWTGIKIDTQLPDQAIVNAFLDGFGDQTRFAYDEGANHPDFGSKADELDAYYNGTHPDLSEQP